MTRHLDSSTRIAVIGAGSMGAGIAQVAATAGHDVLLFDLQAGATGRAIERIAADLDGAVKRGKLDEAGRAATMRRLRSAASIEQLAGCGLAIEAVVEQLEVKQALMRSLEAVLDADAVLATNTSSISVTAVAQGLAHPGRLVGWHFFNPATRMKLVEIVCGVETDPAWVPELLKLSTLWGKQAVVAPNTPGFIVNRVARPFYAEGLRLLAERAATASAIDRLVREAGGFAMGPFELMDLIGVEVNLSVTESVFRATAFDPRFAPHVIQQELVRAGRFGRKNGRGFHDYREGAVAPGVETVTPAKSLVSIRRAAALRWLTPLADRLVAAGWAMEVDADLPGGTLAIDGVRVACSDGRSAAERAAQEGPILLLDLARDYASTPLLGACASADAKPALPVLAHLLESTGARLVELDDVGGLVVLRLVACLINEAADLTCWTPTTAADIDVAMRLGVAYPLGPLAWCDALGAAAVGQVLENLQRHYGDDRYRRSPALSRRAFTGETFHDA